MSNLIIVLQNPEISEESQNKIKTAMTASMTSADGTTGQYDRFIAIGVLLDNDFTDDALVLQGSLAEFIEL